MVQGVVVLVVAVLVVVIVVVVVVVLLVVVVVVVVVVTWLILLHLLPLSLSCIVDRGCTHLCYYIMTDVVTGAILC